VSRPAGARRRDEKIERAASLPLLVLPDVLADQEADQVLTGEQSDHMERSRTDDKINPRLTGDLAVKSRKVIDLSDGQPIRGYAYVSNLDTAPMSGAAPGRRVQIFGRTPPWLVVYHELTSVIVAQWPGRLWAVEVVDPIQAEDFRAIDSVPPPKGVPYTQAAAIKVLHEVPVAALFGARGNKVCAAIKAASCLVLEDAVRFANARHRDASAARARMKCRYPPDREPISSSFLRDDLTCTLVVLASGPGSRLGAALLVIDSEVGRRAEAISGSSAWVYEDEHLDQTWLAEPWFQASAALVDAALAFGVPDLIGDEDRNILATAWRHVIGPDPA
jgi:hypothetical protein